MQPCSDMSNNTGLQEVIGCSPRHHRLAGSRARVELQAACVSKNLEGQERWAAYNVYLRCSSISMIAAWLPHL